MQISEIDGQGVKQFIELASAFLLSGAIGLEREIRHKSAGLRAYTVVGTTAALFLLISKYALPMCSPRIWLCSIRPASPRKSSLASGSSAEASFLSRETESTVLRLQ